jgi:hypothetical protein
MTQSRGKDTSLENFGTINITTATIRRIEDSAPVIAGILGYPDTAWIYRLVSADCLDTREIIVRFYLTAKTSLGCRTLPKSLHPSAPSLAVNHSAKYASVLLV